MGLTPLLHQRHEPPLQVVGGRLVAVEKADAERGNPHEGVVWPRVGLGALPMLRSRLKSVDTSADR